MTLVPHAVITCVRWRRIDAPAFNTHRGMCARKDVAIHGAYASGAKAVYDRDAGEAASWSPHHVRLRGQLPGGV